MNPDSDSGSRDPQAPGPHAEPLPAPPAVEEVLAMALACPDSVARAAYLDRACAGLPGLRREVESLIEASGRAATFLEAPAAEVAEVLHQAAAGAERGPAEEAGSRIGRYRLLEPIGEGGFGVVWMAEQEEPVRRRVALKVIKLGMDTREVVARFEAERQALALMDHPNIARVLDGGATETGRPYFVMELVRGVPITDYCDQRKLPTPERLELFQQVCHAVQHAHQKGIIHRDLKPSNILVTEQDNRPVPKVIDFGVAKATQAPLTGKTLFTRFQQWIGTPAYMSPEQAGLGSLDVDTRSDVYSLGVVLYELLTGRTPFDTQALLAAGYDAVMRVIREEDPPRPSTRLSTLAEDELGDVAARRGAQPARLNHLLRGDLDWIVMKALEKDRTRRYETANALALDIERHRSHEPVMARPPSLPYRLQKLGRRHRVAFAAAAAIGIALILGLAVSTWMLARERAAHRRAVAAENEQGRLRAEAERAQEGEAAERQRAEQRSRQLADSLSQQEQLKLVEAVAQGGPDKALAHLARALRRNPENHRAACRLISMLTYQPVARLIALRKFDGLVRDSCFSATGPLILTSTSGRDLWLWDVERAARLAGPLSSAAPLKAATFSPSGRLFVVVLTTGQIEVRETAAPSSPSCCLEVGRDPGQILFSADESRLLTRGPAGAGEPGRTLVQVWELREGRPLTPPLRCDAPVFRVEATFNPGGTEVAVIESTGLNGRWLSVLDIATGRLSARQNAVGRPPPTAPGEDSGLPSAHARLRPSAPGLVDIIPPGASLQDSREVLLPLTSVPEARGPAERLFAGVSDKALSPDGQRLLTLLTDGTVALWDVGRPPATPVLMAPSRLARVRPDPVPRPPFIEISGDGRRLLLIDRPGTAGIWDAQTGDVLVDPLAEAGRVALGRLSPDGAKAVIGLTNGWVRVWDAATGRPLTTPFREGSTATPTGEAAVLEQLVFSLDGQRLAVAWHDGLTQVRETAGGELLAEFRAQEGAPRHMTFSPDGGRLVTAGPDRTARVWDASTGLAVTPALLHDDVVDACCFSPDGKTLVTASRDRTARMWQVDTGKPRGSPLPHDRPVTQLCFPAPGTLLISVADDQSVRVWDVQSGTMVQVIKPEHESPPAALSADGRSLWAGAPAGLRLWDVTTATPLSEPIRTPFAFPSFDAASCRSASADAHRFAFVTEETVRVWDVPRPESPAPDWLPRLAEILAAQRLGDQGSVEPVSPGEYLALRQSVLADGANDAYTRWGQWFFADRESATIAPSSSVTMETHVRRCCAVNVPSTLREAVALAPGDPAALAAYLEATGGNLASVEQLPGSPGRDEAQRRRLIRDHAREAELLADRLLALVPDSPVGWRVKAAALHRLDQPEGALAALDQVTPPDLRPADWSTRATVLEKLGRLNEAYDGFTQAIDLERVQAAPDVSSRLLDRARYLQRVGRGSEAARDFCAARGIPLRDQGASPRLLDLSSCYTCSLTNLDLLGAGSDPLSELPPGVHVLGGTDFDVRGVIWARPDRSVPRASLASIPVNQPGRALHFLQAAAQAVHATRGVGAGYYVVQYANGEKQEVPIVIGDHLWDWFHYDAQPLAAAAPIVWVGLNERARAARSFTRLFKMTWINPFPELEIRSVDVHFGGGNCVPLLFAVTVDPPAGPAVAGPTAGRPEGDRVARESLLALEAAMSRTSSYAPFAQARAAVLERLGKGEEALASLSGLIRDAEARGAAGTNDLCRALLTRSALLRRMNRPAEGQADWLRAYGVPARDPGLGTNLIDLAPYYNDATLVNFAALPRGRQVFAGVAFDVRGIVRLSCEWERNYPEAVKGIRVGGTARRVHFLHGINGRDLPDGMQLGSIVVHYRDGRTTSIPVVCGGNVQSAWDPATDGAQAKDAEPVLWTETAPTSGTRRNALRLFKYTWRNPSPEMSIEHLDYASTTGGAAPFLVGITIEP